MIYLADNWPEKYRNTMFTVNIHGHRVNNDRLDRIGDGAEVVARHNADFLISSDAWFRGLELKYGPDGGVYVTDWSDIGECHETDADNAHRENGRIFKVVYGDPKPVKVDLARQSDEELARLQVHANEWYVRTARRLLQERAAEGRDLAARASRPARDPGGRSRPRGTGSAPSGRCTPTGGLDEKARLALLADPSPPVRAWAVRLLVDDGPPSAEVIDRLTAMAGDGPKAEGSPLVRLYLASAMQRIPAESRWPIARALALDSSADITSNRTLMIWYGLEPCVARDIGRAGELLARCPNLPLCWFIARRMVDANRDAGLAALLSPLDTRVGSYPSFHREVLDGVLEAVRGLKRAKMPESWPAVSRRLAERGDSEVRARLAALGLLFGDSSSESGLRSVVEDPSATPDARQFALRNLVDRRTAGLAPSLLRLLDDAALRGPAIRTLAAYSDPSTPRTLLDRYAALPPAERDDAIATMASRPAWAAALLDAIRAGTIPRRDVSTTVARQILAFGDPKLAAALERSWGDPPTARDKAPLIAKYKAILTASDLPVADPDRGRASSAGCAASATSSSVREETSGPI